MSEENYPSTSMLTFKKKFLPSPQERLPKLSRNPSAARPDSCTTSLVYFCIITSSQQLFLGKDEKDADGDWCGWHNDHGLLTGLASAMYFDAEGKGNVLFSLNLNNLII